MGDLFMDLEMNFIENNEKQAETPYSLEISTFIIQLDDASDQQLHKIPEISAPSSSTIPEETELDS